jgi:hypothetical protein
MKLTKLIKERERYQQLVNQELTKPKEHQQQELINYYSRQIALKLLADAGYGAFARKELLILAIEFQRLLQDMAD